jgi:hypothetical protein
MKEMRPIERKGRIRGGTGRGGEGGKEQRGRNELYFNILGTTQGHVKES